MASLYQRGKKQIWWIKYYVNGRPVYRSLNTTNARVAQRIRKQIEGDEAKGELLAPSKTSLPELLEDYCRFMSTFRTRKSQSADVSVLRVFFGPISGRRNRWEKRNATHKGRFQSVRHKKTAILEC